MRRIDAKFRIEGDQILNAANEPIPEDEPLFLLRARDYLALPTLRYYQGACRMDGCTDYQNNGIQAAIEAFQDFNREHPERMKQPGISKGKPYRPVRSRDPE